MKPKAVARALDVVSGALFVLMFLIFLVEVFFRYVLDSPISWSMELILVSFLVMLFWTLTFSLPLDRHVAFTVVRDLVPPVVRRIFAIVTQVACAVVLAAAFPGVLSMAIYEQREGTAILRIPLSVNYGMFALFVASYVCRIVLSTIQLLRRDWREHLATRSSP